MNERDVEKLLLELKNDIPVNTSLKNELRKEFVEKKKNRWIGWGLGTVAAAAVFVIALLTNTFNPINPSNPLSPVGQIERAYAATLKVFNQISFVDLALGDALGASEYAGNIYVPIAGKGLYKYNSAGFNNIYNKDVNFARVSGNGKKLTLASNGSIYIYDIDSGKASIVLKGDNVSTYYEQPSWAKDNNAIVYVKKVFESGNTHGFVTKESSIYKLDLKTSQSIKLADGSYPSLMNGLLLYEKDGQIIIKNLKDQSTKVLDSGKSPAISPDGSYVAYVKTVSKMTYLSKLTAVRETVDNIWIADTDLHTKKQVTSNYAYHYINENEWNQQQKNVDILTVLEFTGRYSYYEPSWSSNSQSLFVVKNLNEGSGQSMRLMRVDFARQQLTAQETLKRFFQALIIRDDDYARSLMKSPPEILTVSNPHTVGYKILGAGVEKGVKYVDAEVFSEYTANPYYAIDKSRYYLKKADNGYQITSIKKLERHSFDESNLKEIKLPTSYIPKGSHRFSVLGFDKATNNLIFTIQALEDGEQKPYVEIISYNLQSKKIKLFDTIKTIDGNENIGVSNLIIDPSGKYLAVDLFLDSANSRGYVYIYNLDTLQKIEIEKTLTKTDISNMHTNFWDGNALVYTINSNDQAIVYKYVTKEGKNYSF